jgi:hypothetical protein
MDDVTQKKIDEANRVFRKLLRSDPSLRADIEAIAEGVMRTRTIGDTMYFYNPTKVPFQGGRAYTAGRITNRKREELGFKTKHQSKEQFDKWIAEAE